MTTTTVKYRSTFEREIGRSLRIAGVLYEYEPFKIPYKRPLSFYTPDFLVLPQGSEARILLETKGWFKGSDRAKHLLLKAQHPELDLRFIFQNAHLTLSKTSKTTYADWCNRHGFLWAEKTIPKDWLR